MNTAINNVQFSIYNYLHAWQLEENAKTLINQARSITNGIVPSDLIENNQVRINNLYYNTIGSGADEITTAQADSILEIAIQCPLLGGNAVYEARALYLHYDIDYDYNDELTCLQAGIVMRKKKIETDGISASLYPNPATESVTLKYSISEDAQVCIVTPLGVLLDTFSITPELSEIAVDTKKYSNGIYVLKIVSGYNKKKLKLSIVK